MYVEEKSALHDQWIRVRIVEVILSSHFPEQRTEKSVKKILVISVLF